MDLRRAALWGRQVSPGFGASYKIIVISIDMTLKLNISFCTSISRKIRFEIPTV
jgi:hypothetical protein